MAGDIGIFEHAIVLGGEASSEAVQEAAAAVVDAGGGLTQRYGRVLVAAMPVDGAADVRNRVAPAALFAESAQLRGSSSLASATGEVDRTGELGLEAFALRQSDEYTDAKARRPLAGAPWGTEQAAPPDPPEPDGQAGLEQAQAPLSSRLTGNVAIGLVIVEGPTEELKFSADERTKVVAEVQNGLGWLGSQSSPAAVAWHYDIDVVTLDVHPDPDDNVDEKENRWRDPAMARLGFGSGLAGVRSYAEDLRTRLGTDWGYVAFFTKYPVRHFAYAGSSRVVMQYANDGWGPDNIDRVFAHETGHIFGAPDEYASSGCDCGGAWGHFKEKNGNCENCATNGVACIMKSNDWDMCLYTPFHLGFPQGRRYSGVFQAGADAHGLWVDADWAHFQAKWQEWNDQGLRLENLEIAQAGGELRYSGVFRAGTGAHGLWALADWDNFQAKWQEWSNQGLRLEDLEITDINGQRRYSGVFRAGTGAHGLWALADWDNFQAKWQEWNDQGLRLEDLTVTLVNGEPRYTGVFRAGSGAHGLWTLADWDNFQAKWQEWSNQGLRLEDLEITDINGQRRYSGVFRAGTGGFGLWANASWTDFLRKWQEWNEQGLRLVDFDVTLTGIEPASAQPVGAMVGEDVEHDGMTVGPTGIGISSMTTGYAAADGRGAVGRGVLSGVAQEGVERRDTAGTGALIGVGGDRRGIAVGRGGLSAPSESLSPSAVPEQRTAEAEAADLAGFGTRML